MPTSRDVRVLPDQGEWKVEQNGQTLSTHQSQEDAIRVARERARADEAELEVHGADGRIRERDSYGHDPRERKG